MKELNCQDLMVGDWFKSVDYNSPFRITAIYDDVVQTQADYQSEIDGNWYSEAEIKDLVPIPLTEEILVKNGFSYKHKEETCSTCSYHHWQLVGEYLALDDCQYWRKEKKDDLPRFRIAGIDVNYVHQLQHLLRLCGIEKQLTI